MSVIGYGPNLDDSECVSCGTALAEGQPVAYWNGKVFCSQPCVQQAMDAFEDELEEGTDWGAAQDQAFAAVNEALASKPQQFVLLWLTPSGEISTSVFATPAFVSSCIPALLEGLMQNEPTIAPPPED